MVLRPVAAQTSQASATGPLPKGRWMASEDPLSVRRRRRIIRTSTAADAGVTEEVRGVSFHERNKDLWSKYDRQDEGFITFEQFEHLMKELDDNFPCVVDGHTEDWDAALREDVRNMRVADIPKRLRDMLHNRCVLGKTRVCSKRTLAWSCLGMFVGIYVLGLASKVFVQHGFFSALHARGLPFILGSFGTVSILIFGQPSAPTVKFWNVVMGHIIGAMCSLASVSIFGNAPDFARAIAMTASLGCMLWTGSLHPPGGAIAMLMVEDMRLRPLKQWYALYPALSGTLILLALGCLTNKVKRFDERRGARAGPQ